MERSTPPIVLIHGTCLDPESWTPWQARGFFRSGVATTDPLAGADPMPMEADGFFESFANTRERTDSDAASSAMR